MKNKTFWFAARFAAILALAACAVASAQAPTPRHFSGTISDYTPQNAGGGPWEVRGTWSLKLNHDGTADFSAALNMTHDDYWVDVISPASVNDDTSTGRNPHTHHITLTGASVSSNVAGCAGLYVSNGTLGLTGNGNTMFAGSAAEICITGGNAVSYSNITLTFVGPATGHFGPQAIHGVVRKTAPDGDHDDHDGGDHDGQ
ncbi:MAG TPA: hypothetical protein VJS43_09750 [Candidatus Acidoferrales bacterium]|nr:hypothetical protein [Candidatus Acidoferrales bacterium]